VVSVGSDLGLRLVTRLAESPCQESFPAADELALEAQGFSPSRSGIPTLHDFRSGAQSSSHNVPDAMEWQVDGPAEGSENLRQQSFVGPDLGREHSERLSGSVGLMQESQIKLHTIALPDQVVAIETKQWSGHVYNLQTRGGWYSANGIIAHNCGYSR